MESELKKKFYGSEKIKQKFKYFDGKKSNESS